MGCDHTGLRDIRSAYDRESGILSYLWICESCGERLGEVGRETYRPVFDPRGNDRFYTASQTLIPSRSTS